MSSVKLTVDRTNGLAFITLSDKAVHSTVEHSANILVDLDDMGMAVGIELLDLDALIPFDALNTRYHVASDKVDTLRVIQPTINKFFLTSIARKGEVSSAVESAAEANQVANGVPATV